MPCSTKHADWPDASNVIVADNEGDVIIHLRDSTNAIDVRLRCSVNRLRTASPYFDVLLDPTKFSAGIELGHKLAKSSISPNAETCTTVDALPVVLISGVENLPPENDHTILAIAAFFEALHGAKTDMLNLWYEDGLHDTLVLAIISILADQFEAANLIMPYIRKNHKLAADLHEVPENFKEQYARRMLLAGILLENRFWTKVYSAELICRGSKRWRNEQDLYTSMDEDHVASEGAQHLWLRLPRGIEGGSMPLHTTCLLLMAAQRNSPTGMTASLTQSALCQRISSSSTRPKLCNASDSMKILRSATRSSSAK